MVKQNLIRGSVWGADMSKSVRLNGATEFHQTSDFHHILLRKYLKSDNFREIKVVTLDFLITFNALSMRKQAD